MSYRHNFLVVFVILTEKNIYDPPVSIITFQTVYGTALFRENRPFLYVMGHNIESCTFIKLI